MKLSEDIKQLICGVYTPRRFYLTYRRYNKLSKKEKADFDRYKNKYSPREWRGAFIIMYYLKVPFHHRLFRIVSRLYDIPNTEFMKKYRTVSRKDIIVIHPFKNKYYQKEFEFQGFVPIEQVKKSKRYTYLESFPLGGKVYVLNKKLEQPKLHHKSNRYSIWDIQSKYGVPGVTRLNFKK